MSPEHPAKSSDSRQYNGVLSELLDITFHNHSFPNREDLSDVLAGSWSALRHPLRGDTSVMLPASRWYHVGEGLTLASAAVLTSYGVGELIDYLSR